MRYTNVKTFHKDFFKEVEDLPVTVTRYGRPYLVVDKIPRGTKPKKVEFEASSSPPEENLKNFIKCNVGFCKNKATSQKDGKWVCDEHR